MLVIFQMDSWNNESVGRGLVLSDELVSSSFEALARCRSLVGT